MIELMRRKTKNQAVQLNLLLCWQRNLQFMKLSPSISATIASLIACSLVSCKHTTVAFTAATMSLTPLRLTWALSPLTFQLDKHEVRSSHLAHNTDNWRLDVLNTEGTDTDPGPVRAPMRAGK
jgi:hypothetical protein